MASVANLHARIEELSLAIARQKAILRDLEKAKSDVQSDLNSILDPMAKLPVEISSDIFMRCLSEDAIPTPDPTVAPLLFLNVCRSWNTIAISTPSLWAGIRLESPRTELMKLWLSRAHNHPLSISLQGNLDPDVRHLVQQNARQVQTLELYFPYGNQLQELMTPFPSLQTLILGQGLDEGEELDSYSRTANECVEMLRAAPHLVHCTFRGIFYHATSPGNSELRHPNLKHLVIGGPGRVSSTHILRSLTLPAMESLAISHLDIRPHDFLDFLTRSSAPLKSLEMGIENWLSPMVERFLQLLPVLTDLQLEFSDTKLSPFLEILATGHGSPVQLLPNLCHLTVRGYPLDRAEYEKLVTLLSARRASRLPIKTFRGIWWSMMQGHTIDADIRVALQQLVTDGMEIYIGTVAERLI
ncbi:hypothetical protein FB451DRAFT_1125105 [Mycena latifolia]|nr:hypothetical protein FB451DRAFT_1125105 [Mycena latifolia]